MRIFIGILGVPFLGITFIAVGRCSTTSGAEQIGWIALAMASAMVGVISPLWASSDIPIGHHKPSAP